MRGQELFERVVELSGISMVLAPGIIRRSLLDEGVRPSAAGVAHYCKALPRLQARIAAYLTVEEAEQRIGQIREMLLDAGGDVPRPDNVVALRPPAAGRAPERPPTRRRSATRAEMMRSGERLKEDVELPRGGETATRGE